MHFLMQIARILALNAPLLVAVHGACIPDVPTSLLSDPAVLRHPAVMAAFQELERNLTGLFTGSTQDGFSFPVAHASGPRKAFVYNHGVRKFNDSSTERNEFSRQVDSDSIFRVASISKNIATFSALVVENESKDQDRLAPLTTESKVRDLLPSFGLPEVDGRNGGSEITLSMLGTHSSGLPREGYLTDFNIILGVDRADADTIGAEWAGASPDEIIGSLKQRNLMFAPGQRAAYSNAGISVLGFAVANYHDYLTGRNETWSSYANRDILGRLNMTHSFFGTIPDALVPDIAVPGSDNWVDLFIGPGYDPAGGMWTSANDLTTYLYSVWLAPAPSLITLTQRRNTLSPRLIIPDGKQQVGFGWEISVFDTTGTAANQSKTWNIYGKAGDAGGFHSWIDVVPNLGYGLVVLESESQPPSANYSRVVPTAVRDDAHAILLPAFATALADRLAERFAGTYGGGADGGAIADEVEGSNLNATSSARLEVRNGVLFVRELLINGTSAWEGLDRLGWTPESQSRFFSTPEGVTLNAAEGVGEAEQFGPGAQVWRVIPELDTCDWFDFDGYTDQNGWPLSKIVLVEGQDGGVELRYPPYDIVLRRLSEQ